MCLWAERSSCFQNLLKFELLQNKDWKDMSVICKSRQSSEFTQRNRPRDLILKITAKYKYNVNVQMSVWDDTVHVISICNAAVIYCSAATTRQQFQLCVHLCASEGVMLHNFSFEPLFYMCFLLLRKIQSCLKTPHPPEVFFSLSASSRCSAITLTAECGGSPSSVKKALGSGFSTLEITDLKYFPLTPGPPAH